MRDYALTYRDYALLICIATFVSACVSHVGTQMLQCTELRIFSYLTLRFEIKRYHIEIMRYSHA